MLKRVDVAVYNVMSRPRTAPSSPAVQALGLSEDGVGYAMDDNNKALVTADMQAAAEKAKADIIAGTIKVHDYTTDNTCPVQ
jgi:basic membrane protein A and related proteins